MSNLLTRVLISIVGIPFILFVTYYGGLLFFVFVLTISSLATYEYYELAKRKKAFPITLLGLISIVLVDLFFFFSKVQNLLILLISLTLIVGLAELLRKPTSPEWSAISNSATTLFPIFYIGLSLGTLIGLREANLFSYSQNGILIISIFATIWICDTAAYFVGKTLGRKKLYERISPNKTIEGFIAGLVFSFVSSIVAKHLFLDFINYLDSLIIALIVGIFGQLGDLVESLMKRDACVKDSSKIIPGHGGVFDRFDSLIYVAPLLYLYFAILK